METRVEKPRRHKWIAAALALIMTMTVFLTALPPLSVGAASSLKNVIFMFNDIVDFYADVTDDNNVIEKSNSYVEKWGGNDASCSSSSAPDGEKLTFTSNFSGTYFKFYVEFKSSFSQTGEVVFDVYEIGEHGAGLGTKIDSCNITANGYYQFSARNKTHDTLVIFPCVPAAKHTVTLPPDTQDYMFKAVNGTEVEDGKNFQFYLYKRNGMGEREVNFTILGSFTQSYTVENDSSLHSGGTPTGYGEGIGYVVKNVKEDITIGFSATDEKFTPTLDSQGCLGFKGSSIATETSITSGTNYQFNITIKPGYGAPTVTVKRGETGSEETLVATGEGGNSVTGTIYYYTVQNVTTNITIKVIGDPIAKYPVRWADGTEYSFTEKYKGDIREDDTGSWDSVDYGTQVKFQIQMNDGYDPNQVVVLVNGNETSKGADGYYHFTVTGDTGISIRNGTAQKLKYNLDLHDQTEYSATASSTSVEHGQNFTFTITLAEGYTLTETAKKNINVKIDQNSYQNCTIKDLQLGKYQITVKDVKNAGEVTIDAGQIETASYNIAWPSDGTGYTISDVKVGGESKKPTGEAQTAKYGDEVEFEVKLEDGYTNSDYVVTIGGSTQPKSENGVYSFVVKGDTTITITKVEKNTLTFSMSSGEGYAPGNIPTTKYDGTLKFEVTLEEGYEFAPDSITVQINNGNEQSITPQRISGTNKYTITLKNVRVSGDISFKKGSVKKKTLKVEDKNKEYSPETDHNQNQHYKIESIPEVTYGSTFTVNISPLSGWNITKVELVNNNDVTVQTLSKGAGNLYQALNPITENYMIKVTCDPMPITLKLDHLGNFKIDASLNVGTPGTVLERDDATGTWYLKLDENPTRAGFKFTSWTVEGASSYKNSDFKYEIESGEKQEITVSGQWDYGDDLFTLSLSRRLASDENKLYWTTTIGLISGADSEAQEDLGKLLGAWNEQGLQILGYGMLYGRTQNEINTQKSQIKNTVKDCKTAINGEKLSDCFLYFFTAQQNENWLLNGNTYTEKFGYDSEKVGNQKERWAVTFLVVNLNGKPTFFYSDVIGFTGN